MELFSQLGIDWRLLLAQGVNFIILLALLYRFLYKPVMTMLERRETMVAESVRKSQEIDQRFQTVQAQEQEILNQARQQAQDIVVNARETARMPGEKALEKTKAEVAVVIAQAKQQLAREKEEMVAQASRELAGVVVNATKAVTQGIVDERIDRALAQKAIDSLRQTIV